jgi:hypothetical protein
LWVIEHDAALRQSARPNGDGELIENIDYDR